MLKIKLCFVKMIAYEKLSEITNGFKFVEI